MSSRKSISRRRLLRGAGASIALPLMDAMVPALARGKTTKPTVRMAFVYVPNGIDMRNWNPAWEGPMQELPRILKPLDGMKDDFLLLGNLTHNSACALTESGGDHARCCGSYLTGIRVRKTLSEAAPAVSCDQLVARVAGRETRLPSLEIGMEDARQAGDCDDGYSCAYTNNLAWRGAGQPLPPILNPRQLFERLFGARDWLSPQDRERRLRYQRSILDFVADDTASLEATLAPADKRRLDEYLSSIREIELQMERASRDNDAQTGPGMEKPDGTPADFAEHFRLMTDMVTLAFRADLTRVVTFLATREATSRAYREIGIADGHHPLSHHRNDPEMMEKVARIDTYHVQQFASWIARLREVRDGDSSILGNSMIVYGAGLSDGNLHRHDDLPTVLAGRGGGAIRPGRRIVYAKDTPMCNLFLTMMDVMGVDVERFGDATGRLSGVELA